MPRLVFADSSGLIAKYFEGDPDHSAADAEMRNLLGEGARLLTTNYVFDEVVTRIRRLGGFLQARKAGESILSSAVIRRIYIDRSLEAAAWKSYLKFHDQDFSFTDVTGMIVMRRLGIFEVFSFDSDFAKAGFTMLPRRGRGR